MTIACFALVMSTAAAIDAEAVPGQGPLNAVEIHGVAAGRFDPELWRQGTPHLLPDSQHPLLAPSKSGVWRNIYAPSAVKTPGGWRLFYGAWDGVHTGNDRIFSVETDDFITFRNREVVIEHGDFIHACNVNAFRNADGSYEMMTTVYPDENGLNKPAYFTSPDGEVWNGQPAPYPARMEDIVEVRGYPDYAGADINGMNVLLRDEGALHLYFCNFKDFGKVFHATQVERGVFEYQGVALEADYVVNDVKRFDPPQGPVYLMGLHWNQGGLWYSLGDTPLEFGEVRPLLRPLGQEDRYIVAIGWVRDGERLLGALYGAGPVRGLNRNRIFARWLQKKAVFVAEDGTRYEAARALGPDRQLIELPEGEHDGALVVYAEDGRTELGRRQVRLQNEQVVRLDIEEEAPPAQEGQPLEVREKDGVYHLNGPYQLTGTVVHKAGQWRLEAEMTFPTGGYRLGEPEAAMLKSMPPQLVITLPVSPPPEDAMVTQALDTQSVEAGFRGPEDAVVRARAVEK